MALGAWTGCWLRPSDTAAQGFVVTPRVAFDWATDRELIELREGSKQHLRLNGRIPVEGDVMRFPALAETLRAIAKRGRDAFYTGAVAEDMVAELKALGGSHSLDDFAGHSGEWVTPISTASGARSMSTSCRRTDMA